MGTVTIEEPETATLADPSDDSPTGRTFDIDCRLEYELAGPCDYLFQIHAIDGIDQSVLSESIEVSPPLPTHIYIDNAVQHRFMRLRAPAGPLAVHYRARVRRTPEPVDRWASEVPIADVPDAFMHNLMPTRYCESDLLGQAAQQIFGTVATGYNRVEAIVDWIHDNIAYQIGSSSATTTARDAFLQRAGVCRDFAHLGVTFCRALNIPARLVVGYARFSEPPPDFHAVFEAYLGGRWVMFDATRMSPLDEMVRIAIGRDAKDVAFATIFGQAQMVSMSPLIQPAS